MKGVEMADPKKTEKGPLTESYVPPKRPAKPDTERGYVPPKRPTVTPPDVEPEKK